MKLVSDGLSARRKDAVTGMSGAFGVPTLTREMGHAQAQYSVSSANQCSAYGPS